MAEKQEYDDMMEKLKEEIERRKAGKGGAKPAATSAATATPAPATAAPAVATTPPVATPPVAEATAVAKPAVAEVAAPVDDEEAALKKQLEAVRAKKEAEKCAAAAKAAAEKAVAEAAAKAAVEKKAKEEAAAKALEASKKAAVAATSSPTPMAAPTTPVAVSAPAMGIREASTPAGFFGITTCIAEMVLSMIHSFAASRKPIKMTVGRVFKKSGEIIKEEGGDMETLETPMFIGPTATVSMGISHTINMGDYQSCKVDVFCSTPCYLGDEVAALNYAESVVKTRLTREIDDVRAAAKK